MSFKLTGINIINYDSPSCFQVILEEESSSAQLNFRLVVQRNAYDLTLRELEAYAKAGAKDLAPKS